MVKAVNGRQFNNVAGFRCSYGTTVRRVSNYGDTNYGDSLPNTPNTPLNKYI